MPVDVRGFHHFTLLTQDVERAAVFCDGVAVVACLAGGATLQQNTFVRDPDGNLLEFCSHGSGG